MSRFIDSLLGKITMYRLVLYVLIIILIFATIFSAAGIVSYPPSEIVISTLFILGVSLIANYVFSQIFKAPTNVESVYITALILALIINPGLSLQNLLFLSWASVLATASKYILAIRKKHLFNPAAIAVVLTAYAANQYATWWVGTAALAPFVLIGGYLVVRKMQREDVVIAFIVTTLLFISITNSISGKPIIISFFQLFLHSSLLFFAFIMLTEPLTTPPTRNLRILYGIITGLLFLPQIHIGSFYLTPEASLVIGNIFVYFVSPKQKLLLQLSQKIAITPDLVDFVFVPNEKFVYTPGQYMEWTLAHSNPDSRGNRRYFTLASSPTENTIRLGIKFYENGSSYKKSLLQLTAKSTVVATQLAGEFTLPKDPNKKCVFIAGGIGITPFRSMLKYLVDTKEKRDIIVIYSNKYYNEILYTDVLNQAYRELAIRTIYTLTDLTLIPPAWRGKTGRVNEQMVQKEIPDFLQRTFYLSGPHTMVTGFEDTLKSMNVSPWQIKQDFFPGFSG